MIEWSLSTTGQCRKYADVPKGARITSVNGKEAFGLCESCGKPILTEYYYYEDDGVELCNKCAPTIHEPIGL